MQPTYRTQSDHNNVDCYVDAERLIRSITGINKDLDAANEILVHRNLRQRKEIRQAYKQRYGKDLLVSLGSELNGDYEFLVKNLFLDPIQILAHDIHRELKKPGRNSTELTSILCCCTNTELYLLKKAYAILLEAEDVKHVSHRSLESDIRKNTRGAYCQLLEELLKCERYEESPEELTAARVANDVYRVIDRTLVNKDVEDLHMVLNDPVDEPQTTPLATRYTNRKRVRIQACQKCARKGPKLNHRLLISILTRRSKTHIRVIWKVYIEKYGVSLVKEITDKFAEPFRTGINTTIMAQVDLRLLITCQLREATADVGTKDSVLNRIICLRLEDDLSDLRRDYATYFGGDLVKHVKADTSLEYRKLFTLLVNTWTDSVRPR
ncbi:Annexin [Fasciola gigantica]|uniref:Annexin n=1 Tax=Fasciola gigantica TaxID=46835 RepID=A0A504Y5G6_FASGI|nr:Annexin [Fasciola gigantica]